MKSTITRKEIENRYKLKGDLTLKKMWRFLPFMIMTNLSNLLLVSVDGLVVGNFVGADALSAVSIFNPIIITIGVFSALLSSGISTYLSVCMGGNDAEEIARVKHASVVMTIVSAILVGIIQIPIASALIHSYGLSKEMTELTWQYATGVMISMPFGLISTVGVCQLQIVGKMKALMWLAVIEGVTNLVLDLIFVGAMHMGVAGGGYGTACANVVRATLTVTYIYKKTDIYTSQKIRAGFKQVKEILKSGLPECANSTMLAVQNVIIVMILLDVFGKDGGVIRGVCTFALSLVMVAVNGVQGSVRPLVGLYTGFKGWESLRILVKQAKDIMASIVGIISLIIIIFPEFIYNIHGVDKIPEFGVESLRIFSLCFILKGFNAIYRLYFANRGKAHFSSAVTVAGSLIMPIAAFIISKSNVPYLLWISYFLSEFFIWGRNYYQYQKIRKADEEEEEQKGLIRMTLKPDQASQASHDMMKYAEENHMNSNIAYKMGLCIEEMVAYAKAASKKDTIDIQIIIRFYENEGIFMMIDDGACLSLNTDKHSQELITDNYELLKKLCKSYEYTNIIDLNYTTFVF